MWSSMSDFWGSLWSQSVYPTKSRAQVTYSWVSRGSWWGKPQVRPQCRVLDRGQLIPRPQIILHNTEKQLILILPQVHLQKSCYDFNFFYKIKFDHRLSTPPWLWPLPRSHSECFAKAYNWSEWLAGHRKGRDLMQVYALHLLGNPPSGGVIAVPDQN